MKYLQRLGKCLVRANPMLITAGGLSVAALLRAALTPLWGSGHTFITFYPAIMLSTLVGSWKHGLIATVVAALLAFVMFFDDPRLSLGQTAALSAFLTVNLLMIFLVDIVTRLRLGAEAQAAAAVRCKAAARREPQARQQAGEALCAARVAALKRMEEALRVSRSFTFEWELSTDRVRRSSSCEEILGVSSEDLTEDSGQNYLRLVHPEDRERLINLRSALQPGNDRYAVKYRIVRSGGNIIVVEESARGFFDAGGALSRLIGISTDVSAREKAEEALRQADRRKDEFLATLAHELRNPLAPLRNSLEILRHRGPLDPALEKMLAMMSRQVSQFTYLVDDLLEVSRISRGKIELHSVTIPLAELMRNAVECAQPCLDACGHTLTVQLPEAPVTLLVDAARLIQVLSNLLNNAAKFTPQGGKIGLLAETAAGPGGIPGLMLSVRDNGIGIPHQMRERIFDMFAQAAPRGNGLGIGLSLVRQMVALHGGTVTVCSDGPGLGSEFRVWLPPTCLVETPPDVTNEPLAIHLAQFGRRILVVDDNHDVADSMAALLEVLGWQVKCGYNGSEALQAMSAWRPQAVFLDIGMDGMDGCEVARRIRADPGNAAVILVAITGWDLEDMREKIHRAGFHYHLVKPVDLNTLETLLADLEGGRS